MDLQPVSAAIASGVASAPAPRASGAASPAPAVTSGAPVSAGVPVSAGTPVTTAPAASRQQVEEALKDVRSAVARTGAELQFSMDDTTGQVVVKVVDMATNKVVRQMPSEQVLAMAQSLDKLQGTLLKDKA